MKNTIYKIGLLLFAFAVVSSCESPEAETNYTRAQYEFPQSISLGTNNIKTTSFDLSLDINGGGQVYYVVVEGGSDAPSNSDVFNGVASGLVESGAFELTGAAIDVNVSSLCNNASYDVYAVQFTSDSFLSDSPESTSITTGGLDIAGTYSAQPFAFGEDSPAYTATLTAVDGTTDQFTIDSAWGPNWVAWATGDPGFEGIYVYSGVITINADNSITIVGDDGWSAIGGSGEYDPSCVNVFSYTLQQELFAGTFTVDNVLTQDQP